MPSEVEQPPCPASGLDSDVVELTRLALRDRWGLALVAVGCVHLAIFLTCQYLYGTGDRAESHFLPLWGLDLAAATLIFRKFMGGASRRPFSRLHGVVVRIWVTFLILTFSAALQNSLVGFETDWFKATWATLGTFGFAVMAWIFHLKFLIPAVQMSLTAMMIARFPDYAYGIYAISWCLALSGIGLTLERRRASSTSFARPESRRSRKEMPVRSFEVA